MEREEGSALVRQREVWEESDRVLSVKKNPTGCVYQFRGQFITMACLRAHPGIVETAKDMWNRALSSQDSDVKLSFVYCFQQKPITLF